MPLTKNQKKAKSAMSKFYGPEKGEDVFYASLNAGTIPGGHAKRKKKHKRG